MEYFIAFIALTYLPVRSIAAGIPYTVVLSREMKFIKSLSTFSDTADSIFCKVTHKTEKYNDL